MPTLNVNNCYNHVLAQPAQRNEHVDANWLDQLVDMVDVGEREDLRRGLNRHNAYNHHANNGLRQSLRQLYIRLTDPNLNPELRQQILIGLPEGIDACGDGYQNRIQLFLQQLDFPNSLTGIIQLYREDLVNRVARNIVGNAYEGVHIHNGITMVAARTYGTRCVRDNDYYGNMGEGNPRTEPELRAIFNQQYTFFRTVDYIQNIIKGRLAFYGYNGRKDGMVQDRFGEMVPNSYQDGEVEPIYQFIRQYCPNLPEHAIMDSEDENCIFDIDEDTYAINDINWSRISKLIISSTKDLNYFNFNAEDQHGYDLLMDSEQALEAGDLLSINSIFGSFGELLLFCENNNFLSPARKIALIINAPNGVNVFENQVFVRLVGDLQPNQALELLENKRQQVFANPDLLISILVKIPVDAARPYLDGFDFNRYVTSLDNFKKMFPLFNLEQQRRMIRESNLFACLNNVQDLKELFQLAAEQHYELLFETLGFYEIALQLGRQLLPGMGGYRNNENFGRNLLELYKLIPEQYKLDFFTQMCRNDLVVIERDISLLADFLLNTQDEDKARLMRLFPGLYRRVVRADDFVNLYRCLPVDQQNALYTDCNVQQLAMSLDDLMNIYEVLIVPHQEDFFNNAAHLLLENIGVVEDYVRVRNLLCPENRAVIDIYYNDSEYLRDFENILYLIKNTNVESLTSLFEIIDIENIMTRVERARYYHHNDMVVFVKLIKSEELNNQQKINFILALPNEVLQRLSHSQDYIFNKVIYVFNNNPEQFTLFLNKLTEDDIQHIFLAFSEVFDNRISSDNINAIVTRLGAEYVVSLLQNEVTREQSRIIFNILSEQNKLALIQELVDKKKIDLLAKANITDVLNLNKDSSELVLRHVSSSLLKSVYSSVNNLMSDLNKIKDNGYKINCPALSNQVKVHSMKFVAKGGAFTALAVISIPLAAGISVAAVVLLAPGMGIAVLAASIVSAGLVVAGCASLTTHYLRKRNELTKLEADTLDRSSKAAGKNH